MTDKEKLDAIRAEIHRLVDVRGYDREIANDLFAFMDSLPNEPVSEDLNEAAKNYAATGEFLDNKKEMIDFQKEKSFKAGAKWQKEQIMKDAIKLKINRDTLYDLKPIIHEKYQDYKIGDKVKVIIIKEEGV